MLSRATSPYIYYRFVLFPHLYVLRQVILGSSPLLFTQMAHRHLNELLVNYFLSLFNNSAGISSVVAQLFNRNHIRMHICRPLKGWFSSQQFILMIHSLQGKLFAGCRWREWYRSLIAADSTELVNDIYCCAAVVYHLIYRSHICIDCSHSHKRNSQYAVISIPPAFGWTYVFYSNVTPFLCIEGIYMTYLWWRRRRSYYISIN